MKCLLGKAEGGGRRWIPRTTERQMGHYLCDLWQLLPQWSHSGIGQVALSSSLNFGIILKVSHGRLSWRGHAVSMREPYPADFHMNGLPVNSAACRGQVCWGSHRFSVLSLGYLQVAVGGGGSSWGSVDTMRQAVSSLHPFSGGSVAFLQLPLSCPRLRRSLPWSAHVSSPSLCGSKTRLPFTHHTLLSHQNSACLLQCLFLEGTYLSSASDTFTGLPATGSAGMLPV